LVTAYILYKYIYMPRTYKKRSRLKGGVTFGLNDEDMFLPPSPEPSLEQDRAIDLFAAMRTPATAVDDDDDDDERQRLLDRAERERAAASTIDQALRRYTRRRRTQANLSDLVDSVKSELELRRMLAADEEKRVARREAYERQQQIDKEKMIREERNLAERMDRARHTIAKNVASRRQIQEAKDELERLRQIQEEIRERQARNLAEERSRRQVEEDRARKLATILSRAQAQQARRTKKIQERVRQQFNPRKDGVKNQLVQNWMQKAKDLVKKKKFSQYITDLKSNIKTGNITSIAASIQAGEQILREGNISPTDRDSLEDALKLARYKLVELRASNIFGTNSNQYINQERLKKSSLSRRTAGTKDERNIGVPDTGDLVIIRPAPPSILFPDIHTRQIVKDLEGRLAVVLTGRPPAHAATQLYPLPKWNDKEHYIVLVLPSNDGYLNDRVFELEIYNKDLEWPTPPIKCTILD
jgi:hypothetical protein